MRAVLKLTIDYDNETMSSDKDIERVLSFAAQYLASNGLLSDEHSIIDEWGFIVEVSTQEGGE
tara:strand:- start:71 stop:259 length:189 start_codon:yes stop_codon:yes gene_type:complete